MHISDYFAKVNLYNYYELINSVITDRASDYFSPFKLFIGSLLQLNIRVQTIGAHSMYNESEINHKGKKKTLNLIT